MILEIEAGTTIYGDSATNGTLVIARGSQIHAHGTAAAPIVMTSDQLEGERARGDWGGLIINGYAPLNIEGGEAEGEGDTGTYGGDDPTDSSGILEYVRVEFAGTEFSPDNELNGIAFQGVGSGTTVENVMVKFNKDDGLEFFGGTVEVKYVRLLRDRRRQLRLDRRLDRQGPVPDRPAERRRRRPGHRGRQQRRQQQPGAAVEPDHLQPDADRRSVRDAR